MTCDFFSWSVLGKEQRRRRNLHLRMLDRGLGFCPLEKLSILPSAEKRLSVLRLSVLQLELASKAMLDSIILAPAVRRRQPYTRPVYSFKGTS